jgi:hypothetical protein
MGVRLMGPYRGIESKVRRLVPGTAQQRMQCVAFCTLEPVLAE